MGKHQLRLDQLLCKAGLGSRKEVKALIKKGQVSFQGRLCSRPGQAIPLTALDALHYQGEPLDLPWNPCLMLHKAAGVLTALSDPFRPTIKDALPEHLKARGLVPAGRLDLDTTGLLLLSSDGQLIHRLTAPKWAILKRYEIVYAGPVLGEEAIEAFAKGIEDGRDRFLPASLEVKEDQQASLWLQEGKYHQVKRMFAALGREVTALHRSAHGPITLDPSLAAGEGRLLTAQEKTALYEAVNLSVPEAF